ncbi:MAG: aminotransferase class V-fold PLP-dependent enzyme, partial [Rhodothermales bacterium]
PVLDAYLEHVLLESRIGGYEAAAEAQEAVEHTYDAVARLLNCRRDEVAIVENATRAWDMAFYSIPFAPGDRILTSQASYASNYIAFLHVARHTGAVIEPIANDEYGQISVECLQQAIDERVKLIALTHVPTNGGLVNPAAEVGRVAKEVRIPFLLDACQSAGQMPLDVEALGADMLSATSRKFLRGPRGIGFLYVRRRLLESLEPPFLDLHAATWTAPDRYVVRPDARRFENWEANIAAKIAFGVAVDYALSLGLDAIWQRIHSLAEALRDNLRRLPGVTVHDLGRVRCGIVTFSTAQMEAVTLRDTLRDRSINVSVVGPASTRLDAAARRLPDLVRASVHYFNTEEEIDRFCSTLEALLP